MQRQARTAIAALIVAFLVFALLLGFLARLEAVGMEYKSELFFFVGGEGFVHARVALVDLLVETLGRRSVLHTAHNGWRNRQSAKERGE